MTTKRKTKKRTMRDVEMGALKARAKFYEVMAEDLKSQRDASDAELKRLRELKSVGQCSWCFQKFDMTDTAAGKAALLRHSAMCDRHPAVERCEKMRCTMSTLSTCWQLQDTLKSEVESHLASMKARDDAKAKEGG